MREKGGKEGVVGERSIALQSPQDEERSLKAGTV